MHSFKDTSKLQPVLTISELTAQIRDLLEDAFDQVAVVGEISNAKVYGSGHWYFSLKDKDATLPCVCFKGNNAQIKFNLEDGLMVVARGKLNVWPPRGAYQMVVTTLEPVGIGDWQLAFEQLKEKLGTEGLLAPERKRPLPLMPKKIGVVTSLSGAALRDVLSALRRRNRNVGVVISPCKVQGEGSAEEIARAIEDLQKVDGIEVILIARGGGSIEDLWSFNTEVVARAVASSSIPTVSGVGHETDITICDLVADLRAPTPTAAAELVAKGSVELLESWGNLQRRLTSRMTQLLADTRWSLSRLDPTRSLLRYFERLKHYRLRVDSYQQRLITATSALLNQSFYRWRQNHEKLLVLSPINILGRGFAIVETADGQVVRKSSEVSPGQVLEVLLHKGKLKVTVESLEGDWY